MRALILEPCDCFFELFLNFLLVRRHLVLYYVSLNFPDEKAKKLSNPSPKNTNKNELQSTQNRKRELSRPKNPPYQP